MDADRKTSGIGDLRVAVYLRTVHPEFFAIRARRAFHQKAFEAEVWLLDPGHVLSFTHADGAVTEVVVPRHVELPRRGLARQVDVRRAGSLDLEFRGPVRYCLAYQADAEEPETYQREAEELLAGARQGHLFSETPRQLAGRAFSYAVPELRARSLLVHAWHGFPEACTILKTQTLIEWVTEP